MKKHFEPARPSKAMAESVEEGSSSAVPEHILSCVKLALSDYQTHDDWERVRSAILSSGDDKQESPLQQDRFLSTEELCSFLHVSRISLYRYAKSGKIHAYSLGRRKLYSLADVTAAVKREASTND